MSGTLYKYTKTFHQNFPKNYFQTKNSHLIFLDWATFAPAIQS